jgi:hypothetical protein
VWVSSQTESFQPVDIVEAESALSITEVLAECPGRFLQLGNGSRLTQVAAADLLNVSQAELSTMERRGASDQTHRCRRRSAGGLADLAFDKVPVRPMHDSADEDSADTPNSAATASVGHDASHSPYGNVLSIA